MIKFFRRIRQQLLTDNKFSKYLLYAIGEIFLVVFGILIALQLNNGNEKRKNLESVNNTIDALETELLTNYDEATSTLTFWNKQDSIIKKIIYDELTIEDYRKNDLISIVPANWYKADPEYDNLLFLLEKEGSVPKELKPIIDTAKKLQGRSVLLEQQWEILRANISDNVKKLTENVSMARNDSLAKEDRFRYMLNDPDYKQLVELYWLKAQVYSDFISRVRAHNMALYSTIKVTREQYSIKELEEDYKSKGMNAFQALGCDPDQPVPKNKELRKGYLIGNLSDEDVTIEMRNDGKVGGLYTLKPNQFRDSRPEYAGLKGDYTAVATQLDRNGNCVNRFVGVNKGYLIIE